MDFKNSVKAFKALYNKISNDKHVEAAKTYAKKYYKQAGAVAVVATLGIVCAGTAIGNVSENKAEAGIMMSVSSIAMGQSSFGDDRFEVASISYEEMTNLTYEADQLAQLEKSEKQIEEILASRQQSKREQAAIEQLTAQETKKQEQAPESVTPVVATPPVVTYADDDGDYEYLGEFTLTAYCACPTCCGQWSNMSNPRTASGTTATAGRTIAADTSIYPFGTQLVINGQVYTVEDTGGAIRGNRIDVFCSSHQEALNFGRRVASVYRVK